MNGNEDLSRLIFYPLYALSKLDSDLLKYYIKRIMTSDDSSLCQALVEFAWRNADTLDANTISEIFTTSSQMGDEGLLATCIRRARYLPANQKSMVLDMINIVSSGSVCIDVAKEIIQTLNLKDGIVRVSDLSQPALDYICQSLVETGSLDYDECAFLSRVIEDCPEKVIGILLKRIHEATKENRRSILEYTPIPYMYQIKSNPDSQLGDRALQCLISELKPGTQIIKGAYYLESLVQFLNPDSKYLVRKIIELLEGYVPENNSIIRSFCKALPMDALWDYESVSKILQAANSVSNQAVDDVSQWLFSIAFSERGVSSRTIGRPGTKEVSIRDHTMELIKNGSGSVLAQNLYKRLYQYAVDEIQAQAEQDQEYQDLNEA